MCMLLQLTLILVAIICQIDHCSFSSTAVLAPRQHSTAHHLFVLAGPFQVGASTKKWLSQSHLPQRRRRRRRLWSHDFFFDAQVDNHLCMHSRPPFHGRRLIFSKCITSLSSSSILYNWPWGATIHMWQPCCYANRSFVKLDPCILETMYMHSRSPRDSSHHHGMNSLK